MQETPHSSSPQPSALQPQHLSSRAYTGRDKAAALRELYGRELMRVDLCAYDGSERQELEFAATVVPLAEGVVYAHCQNTPARMIRSAELMWDGADDIYLTCAQAGAVVRTAEGFFEIPAGGFALMSKARAHDAITPDGGPTACIQVSHAALARLVPRLEEAPMRVLPVGMPGAVLALGYAQLLAQQPLMPAALRREATTHLHELLAGVIRPVAPAALPPEQVAVDVSRLALIERDILSRIDQPQLSLAQVARVHHLTPRQVQRLFARKGTCFSDFVSGARLDRAHAMLADPGQRHRRVLEIALDSGFDDVSAFSRAFRRHFGLTPSDVRGLAFGATG